VFQIQRKRVLATKVEQETVYGITSLSRAEADAERLLGLNRGHWAIENGLHGIRDTHLGEDACRVRREAAPQVLAATRNAVVHLLHQAELPSLVAAMRRFTIRPLAALALMVDQPQN
jgi:predicted transposase YbfD/YdcC